MVRTLTDEIIKPLPRLMEGFMIELGKGPNGCPKVSSLGRWIESLMETRQELALICDGTTY